MSLCCMFLEPPWDPRLRDYGSDDQHQQSKVGIDPSWSIDNQSADPLLLVQAKGPNFNNNIKAHDA